VLGMVAVLLWPRYPMWEVKEIRFEPGEISNLIQAFTDPTANSTLSFTNYARVEFSNPNFVGAIVDKGDLAIDYESHKLGHVELEPMQVKGRELAMAVTHNNITMTPELSKILLAAAIPTFQIRMHVAGDLPAKVPALMGMLVNVGLDCFVDINVLALLQDPNTMVVGHDCKYNVRF